MCGSEWDLLFLRMWVDPTAEFLWSQHSTESSHSDAEAPVESFLFKGDGVRVRTAYSREPVEFRLEKLTTDNQQLTTNN